MRKLAIICLSLLLGMTMFGCSESLDGKAIYQDALAKMSELDSIKMEMVMDLDIGWGENESSLSIPMNITFIGEDINSDDPRLYTETTVEFMGVSSTNKQWMQDGLTYSDSDGEKEILEGVDFGEAEEVLNVDFGTDLTINNAVKEGDNIKIEATIPYETFKDLLANSMGDTSSIEDFETDDPIAINIFVDSDGYISQMDLNMELTMAEVGTMSLDATYTYSDINEASIPDFDPVEFGGLYQSGYVYGDYDLKIEDANALIALGFEDMGDYVYFDGEYYIDLEYKQLYNQDGSIIYDWEFDQGLYYGGSEDPKCVYDFTLEYYTSGDESICDIPTLQSYRDAYNEIAASILDL